MDFTLFKSSNHNCSHLVISAMMKRLKLPYEIVWSQAGLIFSENQKGIEITPYYKDFPQYWEERFGFRFLEYYDPDPDSLSKRIEELLRLGVTVG